MSNSKYIASIDLLNIYYSIGSGTYTYIQVFRELDMVTEAWSMVTEVRDMARMVHGIYDYEPTDYG